MKEIRKRLLEPNDSSVVFLTLVVLESIMKNCSSDLHKEVLSPDFLKIMKDIVISPKVCV